MHLTSLQLLWLFQIVDANVVVVNIVVVEILPTSPGSAAPPTEPLRPPSLAAISADTSKVALLTSLFQVLLGYIHIVVHPYNYSVPKFGFFRKKKWFLRSHCVREKPSAPNLYQIRSIFQQQ